MEQQAGDQCRYVCETCNCQFTSKISAEAHLRGRRHLASLDRINLAERSVFVRGFDRSKVTVEELQELFSRFGDVRRVSLNDGYQKMVYCFVEFASVDASLRALKNKDPLLLHGKKLVVKPRKVPKVSPPRRKKKRGNAQEGKMEVSDAASPAGGEEEEEEEETVPSVIGGIQLAEESVAILQRAETIESQINALASTCGMTDSTLESHLSLCSELQLSLQTLFPGSMLVPFGAPISGQAMVTSDCDLCLITEPSECDREFLTGASYYSEKHLKIIEKITSSDPNSHFVSPPRPQPAGLPRYGDTSSATSSSASPSPVTTPTYSYGHRSPLCPKEFDTLLSFIKHHPKCSRIQPIPYARCPIVRFVWSQTGTHCDLSINNRLGPYNTRLMKAYCEFDGRLLLLIGTLRCWLRSAAISRNQISSYALTVLLIYALQNASPPVLPCLQDPGVWERDMKWFASQGFSGAATAGGCLVPMLVEGWRCDFVHPGSLVPSKNSSSVAELLTHFFKFYSSQFNFSDVVTIHCSPTSRLSIQQVSDILSEQLAESKAPVHVKRAFFKVSSLCIQDPIELSHNLTKSVNHNNMVAFRASLESALKILRRQIGIETLVLDGADVETMKRKKEEGEEEEGEEGEGEEMVSDKRRRGNLFCLFDPRNYTDAKRGRAERQNQRQVSLSRHQVMGLIRRSERFLPLLNCFQDLDLTSSETLKALSCAVARILTSMLVEEMNIVSEVGVTRGVKMADKLDSHPDQCLTTMPQHLSEESPRLHPHPGHVTHGASSDWPTGEHTVPSMSSWSVTPKYGEPQVDPNHHCLAALAEPMEGEGEGEEGEGEEEEGEEGEGEDGMLMGDGEVATAWDVVGDISRKRHRSGRESSDDSHLDSEPATRVGVAVGGAVESCRDNTTDLPKKPKLFPSSEAGLDVLYRLLGEGKTLTTPTYTCTAYSNTWQKRRRQRRAKLVSERATAGEGPSISSLASSLPPSPPVLQFSLTVVPPSCVGFHPPKTQPVGDCVCAVVVTPDPSPYHVKNFYPFFAVFKKQLTGF